MAQIITKLVITFVIVIVAIFAIRRTWKGEVDVCAWFKKPGEKLIPIKEQDSSTDATGALTTNEAPLFEDKVDVYWGSNLARQTVATVGSRQIVRAFKGLDVSLDKEHIKVSAKILSSDGKLAVQITDNEWEINPNTVYRKNFDKRGLEVIDNHGLPVLQVDLLDKHTLTVAGFFESEGNAICVTDTGFLRVPLSEVNEHSAQMASMLKSQDLMFRYPADKHFGQRTDRPQIKLPGRDERLSTKKLADKRKQLAVLSNVDLKKRLQKLVGSIHQSISHGSKDIHASPDNIPEELKEFEELLKSLGNTADPTEKRKLLEKLEKSRIHQRMRAPLQEYEAQFKPDLLVLYDEIAFRLATRAKEMPRRVLFESPPTADFLNEALDKLADVAQKLESN